jgi:hypothetical protein
MLQTIVAEIRPGHRVVGAVTLGARGRVGTVRYHVIGVAIVTGVSVVVAGVSVVVVIIVISVAVARVAGIVVTPVAITQRATGLAAFVLIFQLLGSRQSISL